MEDDSNRFISWW